ncbi:hypothetical protein BDW60DRAFT_6075 [Aspergillus nidulans var. acristatus]
MAWDAWLCWPLGLLSLSVLGLDHAVVCRGQGRWSPGESPVMDCWMSGWWRPDSSPADGILSLVGKVTGESG